MPPKGQPTPEITKQKMREAHARRRTLTPEDPDPPRTCKVCGRTLPPRLFIKVRTTARGVRLVCATPHPTAPSRARAVAVQP